MHRFWFFPLSLGICGALYASVSSWESWVAYHFCQSSPMPLWIWDELSRTWQISALGGFFVGAIAGVVGAWSELVRRRGTDRNGLAASERLCRNGFWIGLYAAMANGMSALTIAGLLKTGVLGLAIYRYWFPSFFFLGFGVVNFAAILWMLWRTVETDDVLRPGVLLGKLHRSTRALE